MLTERRHFVIFDYAWVKASAMDGNFDLLINGHSFVHRLQDYVLRKDTSKVVGADLCISVQFSDVFLPWRRGPHS